LFLAQSFDYPVKWFRPRRVARAMRKQNDGGTSRLAHIELDRSRIAPSVADSGKDRSAAAG